MQLRFKNARHLKSLQKRALTPDILERKTKTLITITLRCLRGNREADDTLQVNDLHKMMRHYVYLGFVGRVQEEYLEERRFLGVDVKA